MDFVCKNRQQCLFHSMVCDGIVQCRDGSDEDAAFAGCCEWMGGEVGRSVGPRRLACPSLIFVAFLFLTYALMLCIYMYTNVLGLVSDQDLGSRVALWERLACHPYGGANLCSTVLLQRSPYCIFYFTSPAAKCPWPLLWCHRDQTAGRNSCKEGDSAWACGFTGFGP